MADETVRNAGPMVLSELIAPAVTGNSSNGHGRPPLGLPVGSVRALITLSLIATIAGLLFIEIAVPEQLWVAFALGIGHYYGQRSGATA